MVKYNLVQAQAIPNGTRWLHIGVMFEKSHGTSIKLDVIPVPNKDGEIWIQAFERKDDEVPSKGV